MDGEGGIYVWANSLASRSLAPRHRPPWRGAKKGGIGGGRNVEDKVSENRNVKGNEGCVARERTGECKGSDGGG